VRTCNSCSKNRGYLLLQPGRRKRPRLPSAPLPPLRGGGGTSVPTPTRVVIATSSRFLVELRLNSLVISVERSSLQLQLTPLRLVHHVEHDVDDHDGKANQGQRED